MHVRVASNKGNNRSTLAIDSRCNNDNNFIAPHKNQSGKGGRTRRRFVRRLVPKQLFLGLFLFWIGLSSRHNTNTTKDAIQLQGRSPLLAPTMVLSFTIPTPAMLSRAMMRRSSRRSSLLPLPYLESKPIPRFFRFYSATAATSSDLDGFFEKGGDMDRLVQELSGDQQQGEEENSTELSIHRDNGWLQGRDIISLVETVPKRGDSSSNSHNNQQVSPVEEKTIRNRTVYIKHDDQLRLLGSGVSGNKARKMWTLNEISPEDFPSCLVSYGGPQSNSMLALAAIANYKSRQIMSSFDENDNTVKDNNNNINAAATSNTTAIVSSSSNHLPVRFVYYTKKLPRFLRKQPNGNFFRALSLGMELVEVSHEEYADLFEQHTERENSPPMGLEAPVAGSLWVPQGGAFPPARKGAKHLALEIFEYWSEHGNGRPLTVCVPGGTCTTALLLHHELQKLLLPISDDGTNAETLEWEDYDETEISGVGGTSSSLLDIEVVVIPCVGDANYARRQMMSLSSQIGASPENIPTILQPQPEGSKADGKKYFSFGKPDKAILDTFQELQEECNLLVDLIYGAPSFAILWRHWNSFSSLSPDLSFDPKQPLLGREIMYVHSGGLEGINSQLLRYKYNGLVEIKDVQLPGRQNRSKPTRRSNNKRRRQ